MPLVNITPSSASVTGEFMGFNLPIDTNIGDSLIPDIGGFLVSATLTPDEILWSDYGTNPMGYTLEVKNSETFPLISPISVAIQFDKERVAYEENSMSSDNDTQFEDAAFDADKGTLTFKLTDDIVAGIGNARVKFNMTKAATE